MLDYDIIIDSVESHLSRKIARWVAVGSKNHKNGNFVNILLRNKGSHRFSCTGPRKRNFSGIIQIGPPIVAQFMDLELPSCGPFTLQMSSQLAHWWGVYAVVYPPPLEGGKCGQYTQQYTAAHLRTSAGFN